jgi:hypothetical protein
LKWLEHTIQLDFPVELALPMEAGGELFDLAAEARGGLTAFDMAGEALSGAWRQPQQRRKKGGVETAEVEAGGRGG